LLWKEARGSQRDLSRPEHASARVRIYAERSLCRCSKVAACQGGGAALWLSALPTQGVTRMDTPGVAIRAAAQLCLGTLPRSVTAAPHGKCGCFEDSEGCHYISTWGEQTSLHIKLHHNLVHLVAEALHSSPAWGDASVEAVAA